METEKMDSNALAKTLSELAQHFRRESTDANHRYLYHRDRQCVAAQRAAAWSAAMASAADQVETALNAKTALSLSETLTESTPGA